MVMQKVSEITSAAIGNALTNVQTWGGIVVNAKSFGAKGNGVSDDTQYLQAAIDYISENVPGAILLLPEGQTYVVSTKDANGVFLYWKSGVSFEGGATIKVGNNVGDYRSVFEQSGTLENVSMRDITIDANTANNPLTMVPSGNNKIRTEIFLQTGDNITIDNVTVKNSVGIWSIITNQVSNLKVTNCNLVNMGVAPFHYDTSAIYVAGENARILNNTITAGGKAVTTAIEIHARSKLVQGNIIKGYRTGIINAAVDEVIDDTSNTHIINNIFKDVMTGIALWAISGEINNIHINDNDIHVNNLYFDPYGVEGIVVVANSLFGIDGMVIENNFIRFQPGLSFSPLAAPYNAGIGIYNTNVKNAYILDNTIENSAQPGIAINISGTLAKCHIENNTILNPGMNSGGSYNFGISTVGVAFFEDVYIDKNIIRDERATKYMDTGIACYTASPNTDNARYGLFVRDNIVAGALSYNYFFNNYPVIKGRIDNWTRGSGITTAAYGSEIYDPNRGITYTQKANDAGGDWRAYLIKSQNGKPASLSFTPAYGDMIENSAVNNGAPLYWRFIGDWFVTEFQGNVVGTASPIGSVVPYWEGAEFFDYVNKKWYKATGITNADWVALN